MKIVLATGIYPPAIGGPATYCRQLADHLTRNGHAVTVVTYSDKKMERGKRREEKEKWEIYNVSNAIPLLRWWWYAQKLREVAKDADVVYAFSSVSCGVPLALARLQDPKKVLRLGGDFLWERYTDTGGKKSLKSWYASRTFVNSLIRLFVCSLLRTFDCIVFSTDFQRAIYQDAYNRLPDSSVIENALQLEHVVPMEHHTKRQPFRLICMARFVRFKNISFLIEAMQNLPDCVLTLVGDGPLDDGLRKLVDRLKLHNRVRFVAPASGKEKYELFNAHDLLVLPSRTEISPNTALEARSVGLPVLLTEENGLSQHLLRGMHTADLSTPEKIVMEVQRIQEGYSVIAEAASSQIEGRSWEEVARETIKLFDKEI